MNSLQLYNQSHDPLLIAAAAEGIDVKSIGGVRYIGYGRTKHGPGPICIFDVVGTQYVAEPHVTWFPWVNADEKVKSFKWAIRQLAKDKEVLLNVQKDQIAFFEHFVKKGFLRKIGFIKNLPIVDEVHMYQYERDNK